MTTTQNLTLRHYVEGVRTAYYGADRREVTVYGTNNAGSIHFYVEFVEGAGRLHRAGTRDLVPARLLFTSR